MSSPQLLPPNLFGLDRSSLAALAEELGEPTYRASQLQAWLYRKHARSFEAMTDLSADLRSRLAERFTLRRPDPVEREESSDGTIKFVFEFKGGARVETVYIPERRWRTLCLSTQAGCPLKCVFCVTGVGGFKRNLDVTEILGQVATVMEAVPASDKPWNVVVMGMGEPLLNTDNVLPALRILMDPAAFGVPARRITLSTVGILPGLERLMKERVRPNLAISLHASNPALRRRLVPIEERYNLRDVIAAAQRYRTPRGGRVTYEYVMLRGVNDSPKHARELTRLLGGGQPCKINLIPLNPAPEIPFRPPEPEALDAFCLSLSAPHITVSVRQPRGQDILAACGQLSMKRELAGVVPATP